ncbi:MAG: hypothetical protein JO072_06380 [Parafilimonas sp.]|nr:hypothetical protein [Parafilimonas sp.]
MPDNFTNDITELLIRYMDNELSESKKPAVEKLLKENTEANERYQLLLAAKQAIRLGGLKQRVQIIHTEFTENNVASEAMQTKTIKHPSFLNTLMRVAAVFIIVVTGYCVYEYNTTSDASVFNNNFTKYELPVNRGEDNTNKIDSFYKASNYASAITAFEITSQKDQHDYFIAGQSYLQLNNAEKAIAAFEQVQNLNSTSTIKYFVEETDYYLALAFIKAGKIKAAQLQLDKITADKKHLFYNKAKNISGLKLQVLKWKEK